MTYSSHEPSRADVDALPGATVLEFGTAWCGHCRAAQAAITAALGEIGGVRHLKVEDGPGRALGRSYAVKLWPTLVVLRTAGNWPAWCARVMPTRCARPWTRCGGPRPSERRARGADGTGGVGIAGLPAAHAVQ